MIRTGKFKIPIKSILFLVFLSMPFCFLSSNAAIITPGACSLPNCVVDNNSWMYDPAARAQACTTETIPQYSNCGTVSLNPPAPAVVVFGTRNCNVIPPTILYPTGNLNINSGSSLTFRISAPNATSASIEVRNSAGVLITSLVLYDDSYHNDNSNNDFIFGNTWFIPANQAVGNYYLDVTINGNQTNPRLGSFNISAPSACVQVTNSGNSAQKLDIVYLSDRYTNLANFRADVNRFKNKLLSYPPFSTQINKINIWLVENTDSLGCVNNNRLITCNAAAVLAKAGVCNYDVIGVIVNDATYGGGGGPNYFASYNGAQQPSIYFSENVGVHELGHTFGKLKDEYSYGASGGAIPYDQNSDPFWWLNGNNCDLAGCARWAGQIGQENIGCFINDNGTGHAGCQYNEWYRPKENDTMMLDMGGGFNLVNRTHLINLLSVYQ